MEFDHIAVAGKTLEAATRHVEAALGVGLQQGGAHQVYGTHNTLLGLQEGAYLEAIAIDPDAVPRRQPRWFDLDRFRGTARLTNWVCRCADLEATLADLPDGFGVPVAVARGDLRWRMAVPEDGVLPFDGCAPALMQWDSEVHPAQVLETADVRMTALTLRHPEAAALQEMLSSHLNDTRIRYETGAAGLEAHFSAAGSERVLW